MNEMLADIIREMIERADEAKGKYASSDVEYGRLLGFAEALSIIKQEFASCEEISKLLDFDIDKKYL